MFKYSKDSRSTYMYVHCTCTWKFGRYEQTILSFFSVSIYSLHTCLHCTCNLKCHFVTIGHHDCTTAACTWSSKIIVVFISSVEIILIEVFSGNVIVEDVISSCYVAYTSSWVACRQATMIIWVCLERKNRTRTWAIAMVTAGMA